VLVVKTPEARKSWDSLASSPRGRTHTNTDVRDQREAEDLNRVLREQVMPLYHERDGDASHAAGSAA
jgi:hypothetical protein